MLRTVSTMAALAAFAAAALMALPAFVQASAPNPTSIPRSCELRSWPYYDAQCLRDTSRNAGRAAAVRIVTTDRIGENATGGETDAAQNRPLVLSAVTIVESPFVAMDVGPAAATSSSWTMSTDDLRLYLDAGDFIRRSVR
jgi:hypothetical protein